MALIGKIRKNFWLVLVLLGLALASFVIMDIVGSRNRGSIFDQTTLGKVAGEKIDIMDFQRTEAALYSGSSDLYGRRDQVWNYYVENKILSKESEALGLDVSAPELFDLQFGDNLSPVVQNNFRNNQTGMVDRQQLNEVKNMIEQGQLNSNPNLRAFWYEQEKQIIKTKLQEKLTNLVSKALYSPEWQINLNNKVSTDLVNFDYVRVPFDMIPDSEAEPTDEDYKNYIKENAHLYENKEETRTLSYVVIDVIATSEDSMKIFNSLADIKEEFANAENDSLFVALNNGFYSPLYSGKDDLTGDFLKDTINSMSVGSVIGPFIEGNNYLMVKLIDKMAIPDSVKARHILVSAGDADLIAKANARTKIDSIKSVYQRGGISFDTLAARHSDDPGSNFKGGDLGTFAQGMMVKEFNDACFIGSREGGLYVVETQFGVHLIEVQKRIFNNNEPKYKVAYLFQPIVPSDGTVDDFFDIANGFVMKNRKLDELVKAVEADGNYSIEISAPLKKNDHVFGNLGSSESSREIVKWAFKSKPGEVAPKPFAFSDQVNLYTNKYVVVALNKINPKGLKTVQELKTTIEPLVRNKKKGEMISKRLQGKDLSGAAKEFGVSVEFAENVNLGTAFIPDLGVEPKVVGKAFGTPAGTIGGPVVGNSGVFMVSTKSINPSSQMVNVPQQRRQNMSTTRSQVNTKLLESLKKVYKVEDKRAKFF